MDLHIHTCLSPCAQSDMLPTTIIKQARDKNLDVVGKAVATFLLSAPSFSEVAMVFPGIEGRAVNV